MRDTMLKNRAIYFGINTLAMLAFLFSNFSLINLGVFAVTAALALYFSVLRNKEREPACAFLPVLLFFDVLLYFGLHAHSLWECFSTDQFHVPPDLVIIVAIGGAALALIGVAPSRRWIGWLGSLLFGAALISAVWAEGDLARLAFQQTPEIKTLLLLYVLLTALWFFCVKISDRAATDDGYSQVARRNSWLTVILLSLFAGANLLERDWIISLLPRWEEAVHDLPADMLVWWKVLIAALILAVCAAALCEFKDKSIGTDAYVMLSFMGAIFLSTLLYACFFPLKWVVLLVYAQLAVTPIRAFAKGLAQFRLRYEKYFAAVLLLSTLGTVFLQYNLWLNLLVTAVVTVAIYHLSKPELRKQYGRLFWCAAVLSISAECAGLLLALRWHTANLIMLTLVTVMALVTMLILNMPHPAGKRPRGILGGAVCVFFALICAVLMARHGVKIDLCRSELTAQIEVKAAPRGGDNEIVSLRCGWSDLGQEAPVISTDLHSTEETLAIEGDRLTIEAVDRYGVRTTRTVWCLWHRLAQ